MAYQSSYTGLQVDRAVGTLADVTAAGRIAYSTNGGLWDYKNFPWFASRAALVTAAASATPAVGDVWVGGGFAYEYDGTTTDISDLSGWKPFGDVHVEHFGVVGDASDETTAITAAHDYVQGLGGGILYFGIPSASYTTDTINWHPSVSVRGVGRETTTIRLKSSASGHLFHVLARSNPTYTVQGDQWYPEFHSVKLIGNKANQSVQYDAIYFESEEDDPSYDASYKYRSGRVVNCEIQGFKGNGVTALKGRAQLYMENVRSTLHAGKGVSVNGGNDPVIGQRCGFGACDGISVEIKSCSGPIIQGINSFSPSDRTVEHRALFISNVSGGVISGNIFNDVVDIQDGGGDGIIPMSIVGNHFKPASNVWASGPTTAPITLDGVAHIVMGNNNFHDGNDGQWSYLVSAANSTEAVLHYDGPSGSDASCPYSSAPINDNAQVPCVAVFTDLGEMKLHGLYVRNADSTYQSQLVDMFRSTNDTIVALSHSSYNTDPGGATSPNFEISVYGTGRTDLIGDAQVRLGGNGTAAFQFTANAAVLQLPINLPVYNVAGAPSAVTLGAGAQIYVSDGDAGSPCIAISDGTDWLRIALGSAISAT